MNPDIALTMLGGTESGKTSLLVAMYATMGLGTSGFTFTAADPEQGHGLRKAWRKFLQDGQFPEPTTMSTDYRFHASHGFRRVLDFTWHDYRGDALTGSPSEPDVAELRENVKRSDVLILCIPGDHLAEFCNGRPSRKARETEEGVRMFNELNPSFQRDRGGTIPIVIAITKSDRCPLEFRTGRVAGQFKNVQEILMKDWFSSLFVPSPAREGGWKVFITYVTLGPKLGALQRGDNADPDAIEPAGIHRPVTFALHNTLVTRLEKTKLEQAEKQNSLRAAEAETRRLKDSWRTRIFSYGKIQRTADYADAVRSLLGTMDKQATQLLLSLDRIEKDLLAGPTQDGGGIFDGGLPCDLR